MAEATAREQYILELINRARLDPAGEAARYGIDLNKDLAAGTITAAPKQVLAFNSQLNDAADNHSNWMLTTDTFSHTGSGGSTPGQRMTAAGYQFTGSWTWGENIAWSGTTGTMNGDLAAGDHHRNLFLSSGHRLNILNGNFKEVGIGSITGQFTSGSTTYNALMTTEAFAKSGSNSFVTGVVYDDTDENAFYSIGEGKGGLTVSLYQNDSLVLSTKSGTAGGYALGTTVTGLLDVVFTGGGLASAMGASVNLQTSNIKIDLVSGNRILSSASATLNGSTPHLTLLGIAAIDGTGNALANDIQGNGGNNVLSGLDGNDVLRGFAGNDTLLGGNGSDTLVGGTGKDVLQGGDGDDFIYADINDDFTQINGGAGYDILLVDAASFSFDYAAHGFEEMRLNSPFTGVPVIPAEPPPPPPGAITGTEDDDELVGTDANDILIGLAGNDSLDGGIGADNLSGGADDDTYYIDNTGDVVDETGASGTDTIVSTVSVNLGDTQKVKGSVENVILAGVAAINATGNALNNVIHGNAGNNVLAGGTGIDTVSYEEASDNVTVNLSLTSAQNTGSAGSDKLSGFENVTGSAFNDTLTGTSGANTLIGLAGNDTLNGGSGADLMKGGDGDDIYVFSTATDVADETDGSGIDTVRAGFSANLSDTVHFIGEIENLILTGTKALTGTGNALDNVLIGNTANNVLIGLDGDDRLDGMGGSDKMKGGLGDDTYIVNATGDIADETGGDGNDTIISSITFSLANTTRAIGAIENLTLSGTGTINATGNALDNVITGNAGANQLTGLGGGDSLDGGLGNDTFVYKSVADSSFSTGLDTIFNFKALSDPGTEADKIDLRAIDAVSGGTDNAFTFIGGEAFSASGQLRAYTDNEGNTFITGNTDDNLDTVEFALILRNFDPSQISSGDFLL